MNTADSGFDKELNSTDGFEGRLVQSAPSGFTQSIEQFDLEQSCLMRLKAQREKIEELTKLYQANERELLQRVEREKELQAENERLQELEECQKELLQLRNQLSLLSRKQERTEEELTEARKELDQIVASTGEEIDELRQDLKLVRDQKALAQVHWRGVVADKEEEHKVQMRRAQEKQYDLVQNAKALEEQVEALRELIDEKGGEVSERQEKIRKDLRSREEERAGFEKASQTLRRQISQLRAKLCASEEARQTESRLQCQVIEQLRSQVKVLRRDQGQKQNQLYEYKQMMKKCDVKNQNLQSTVTTLKSSLKKMKTSADVNLKKLTSNSEEERERMQLFIGELKGEVERQVEDKITMAAEIRKLKGVLERKEQQERQRKVLLMNQFREIDRMDKVVKKVL